MGKQRGNGIAGGLVWTFGERLSAQAVSTVVAMVLARLLAPSYYGLISIVTVFIDLCNIFVTSGLGTAVVRKPDADPLDFDTAFTLSLGLSAVLYGLLFAAAPVVAGFYGLPALSPVMRVLGLRLVIAAFNTIQRAGVQREMAFRRMFTGTLAGTLLSGGVGIAAALGGLGVWALVAQQLTNAAATTLVLYLIGSWRPRLRFCRERARYILSFGSKVLAADLIINLERNIRSLAVGKVFGSADLAFYDQGGKYPSLLVDNVNSSINTVMLPAYSRVQRDREQLLAMLRNSVRMGMFLLGPMLIGFGAVAENFVLAILTEKWLPCVPFLQIFCLAYLTRPLETCCHKLLLAIGHGEVPLRVIAAVNLTGLASTLAAVFLFRSILLVALGNFLVTAVSLAGFMSASARYVGYRLGQQLEDVLRPLALAVVMGAAAWLAGRLPLAPLPLLAVQIAVGVAVYGLLAVLFARAQLAALLALVRRGGQKEGD